MIIHRVIFLFIYYCDPTFHDIECRFASVNFLVKTFIKKDLKSIDAIEILKDTKLPIVIFHGGLDFFCNVKISQKIKELNLSNVSVYIYPDSNHCCSYVKHEKEYENIISRLIE